MKMNVKGNDNFQTPPPLFQQLHRIFSFTLDAACTTQNCLCPRGFYYDQGADALKISWGGNEYFAIHRLAKKLRLLKKPTMK